MYNVQCTWLFISRVHKRDIVDIYCIRTALNKYIKQEKALKMIFAKNFQLDLLKFRLNSINQLDINTFPENVYGIHLLNVEPFCSIVNRNMYIVSIHIHVAYLPLVGICTVEIFSMVSYNVRPFKKIYGLQLNQCLLSN